MGSESNQNKIRYFDGNSFESNYSNMNQPLNTNIKQKKINMNYFNNNISNNSIINNRNIKNKKISKK